MMRYFAYGLIAGLILGSACAYYVLPTKIHTITEKEFVPQMIEKELRVPYEVAKEIVQTKEVVKEVKVPVKDPDHIVDVPTENGIKQYNIVLNRTKALGLGFGYHDELYIPVSWGNNYAKDKAIEIELHLDPELNKLHITGGEIKHVWRFK